MTAWIAYALAFSALAGAAALAAEALLRMYRLPARWVWGATLGVSCAAPFLSPARPDAPATPAAVEIGALELAGVPAGPAPSARERVEAAVPALWGGASAALLAALAAGCAVLAARRRRWTPARLVDTAVLVSPDVGPAVVGFARPAIVVPRHALGWPEPMQRMVVRHEAEHLRARDPLLVLAAAVAAALVPWNLAAWWQLRRLRLAVEVDCDARTLRGGGSLATYGEVLLQVGASGRTPRLAAAFAEPRSFLERRIRAMTARTPRNRAVLAAGCAALALTVADAAYTLPRPERPGLLPGAAYAQPDPRVIGILIPDAPAADAGTVKRASVTARADGSVAEVRVLTPSAPRTEAAIRDVLARTRFAVGVHAVEVRVRTLNTSNSRVTVRVDTVVIAVGTDTVPALDISAVDTRPRITNTAEVARAIEAEYPPLLRDAGVGGTVTLEMVAGADGSVRGVRVVSASNPAFGEAAVRAAARIRVAPARKAGRAVAVHFQLPISFQPHPAGTPVAVRAQAPRSARTADRTPELLGRAIDPNEPRVPAGFPQPDARP
jgi:TonB family protein